MISALDKNGAKHHATRYLAALCIGVLLTAGLGWSATAEDQVTADVAVRTTAHQDPMLGDPNAPVTIIEYASLSCPHCADFHNDMMPWVKETFIDTGEANLIYRDFPLNAPALWGAQLAHCTDRDKYFPFLELMFKRQRKWAFADDPKAELAKIANMGGVSKEAFEACMANESLQDEILKIRLDGQNAHDIKSTPSFVINDETISGIPSKDDLTERIEAAAQ